MRLIGRDGLRVLSVGRLGIGAALLAQPALLPRLVGVDRSTARRLSWITRMVGAREVALATGTLLVLRRGGDVREWALGAVLSDATDAAVFAGAVARGHAHPVLGSGVVLAASVSTVVGAGALRDRRRDRTG